MTYDPKNNRQQPNQTNQQQKDLNKGRPMPDKGRTDQSSKMPGSGMGQSSNKMPGSGSSTSWDKKDQYKDKDRR